MRNRIIWNSISRQQICLVQCAVLQGQSMVLTIAQNKNMRGISDGWSVNVRNMRRDCVTYDDLITFWTVCEEKSRQAVFSLSRNRHPGWFLSRSLVRIFLTDADGTGTRMLKKEKKGEKYENAILHRLIWTVSSDGRAAGWSPARQRFDSSTVHLVLSGSWLNAETKK